MSEDYRCARADRCAGREKVETKPGEQCPCQCHGMASPYAICDVEGGCGHLHAELRQPEWQLAGARIEEPAGLCSGCRQLVEQALRELPRDYVELNFLLGSGSSGITDDVITHTRELPVPIRLSVEALQRSIVHETEAWAALVAARLGVSWAAWRAQMSRPGFTVQRAANLLHGALGTLLWLPEQTYRHHRSGEPVTRDGMHGALELLHLHSMVRFAAGRTKLLHRLPAPCPRCERMTLVRDNGSDMVRCEGDGCPGRWPEEDYRRLCLVLAEDYREDFVA